VRLLPATGHLTWRRFQSLREKYDRVIAVRSFICTRALTTNARGAAETARIPPRSRDCHCEDQETASRERVSVGFSKLFPAQSTPISHSLLLDAMNLAASHQPSMFGPLPPSHPPDMPPGGGPMDVADRLPPRHVNGNGNSNGTRSSSSSGPGLQTNGTAHAHEVRLRATPPLTQQGIKRNLLPSNRAQRTRRGSPRSSLSRMT
jgi:hypothetical protein